jgi:hypothetical protein
MAVHFSVFTSLPVNKKLSGREFAVELGSTAERFYLKREQQYNELSKELRE